MFNFNFGKKKPDIKQYAIISIVLTTIIATLSQCTGISQTNIWDILDEVQRKYFPQTILNEFIIKDPEKLDRRIHRDVDQAIAEYERLIGENEKVRIPPPRYSETPLDASVCHTNECRSLGGEIRLCAPWVDGCLNE
jgi:siderophore synthetase component